ncbi:MAG: hypothetical protein K2M87_05035 [Muribaculaceae bacterium]|nr:hypothetical protein [Muribaculaceae bacterium]
MTHNHVQHILIPHAVADDRIGSIFNHVFQILAKTEEVLADGNASVVWDFERCEFLHPFYVAALGVLKSRYPNMIYVEGCNPILGGYLEAVHFHEPLKLGLLSGQNLWNLYNDRSYLPICAFDPRNENISLNAQTMIQNVLKSQIGRHPLIHQVISLLMAELIDNITDHSKSPLGYIFCQRLKQRQALYLYIGDAGQSVYSSYATDARYSHLLSNLESSALKLAMSGKSTKNRPEAENRGYGISKSRSLIVDGLGGAFFMLSGNAFFRHDANSEIIVDLPESIRWDGTVILMEIPLNKVDNLNIYDYIS